MTQRQNTPWIGAIAFVIASVWTACSYAATPLDEQIAAHAPRVIAALARQQDVRNVGVLSFQFQEANGERTSRAGRFRADTARKMETALIASLRPDQAKRMRIVANADRIAAQMPKQTDHMDPQRHAKLFSTAMPTAWGYEEVQVDAFVTGLARLTEDLKELEVTLMYVQKGKRPCVIDSFEIPTNGELLNCVGKRFRRRTVGKHLEDTASAALRVQQDVRGPMRGRVQLTILVDGKPASHAKIGKGNEHLINEPKPGQQVTLKLERTDQTSATLGVVLRVNGVNTLYKQQASDQECAKWVLGPGESVNVKGFRRSLDEYEAFHVLSEEASLQAEKNYGPLRGTISLTVYAEDDGHSTDAFGPPEPRRRPQVSRHLDVVSKAHTPTTPPSNLAALQQALLHQANPNKTRGLITSGDVRYGMVEADDRNWRSDATDSLIIYYRVDRRASQ